ncbi:hypothetical protein M9H77_25433 [Catharanthus roseus]|uniref:Uncharacterized protein n=1 Tax=Catharanthus roseus TaxID=4058 RepID=A0ACC0A8B3_CATRO|nr:hypothetical protein M9H77_25433 [Catharanthus roseus]
MILVYLLDTYLGLRQHIAPLSPVLPAVLKSITSQENFIQSRFYMHAILSLVHEATNVVFDCMILLQGWLPWLRKMCKGFIAVLGFRADNEILQSLAFLAAISIFSLLSLRQYFADLIMRMCLCGLFGGPIAAVAIIIAQLPVGKLKAKVEELAFSLNFPLDKIFLSDGSKRSTHSSAYIDGVFNKSIVPDDTLIKQCKNADEIIAVIVHEMGHWKLKITTYALIGSQVCALVKFRLVGYVMQLSDLYRSFGFEKQPIHVVLPVQGLFVFAMNIISRFSEFKADLFANRLGYGKAL